MHSTTTAYIQNNLSKLLRVSSAHAVAATALIYNSCRIRNIKQTFASSLKLLLRHLLLLLLLLVFSPVDFAPQSTHATTDLRRSSTSRCSTSHAGQARTKSLCPERERARERETARTYTRTETKTVITKWQPN